MAYAKESVSFKASSLDFLYFYNADLDTGYTATTTQANERVLPCKISCSHCRSPVADETPNALLVFATLFGFGMEDGEDGSLSQIPRRFRPTCHLFYRERCIDIPDHKTKWEGRRKASRRWTDRGRSRSHSR